MPPFEDFEEKTEAPTPRRREEARERGQIAKSTDLSAAVSLLAAMVGLNIFGPGMVHDMLSITRELLGYAGPDALSPKSMTGLSWMGVMMTAKIAAPICLSLLVVAVLACMAQVGLVFSFHPLEPNLEKINPISGFFRIFSMESLVKLVMNVIKVLIIGMVAYLTIKGRMAQIVNLTDLDYVQICGFAGEVIFMLGIRLAVVLLVIAILDYLYMRFNHERQLRMSKQELKEELRRMEGDPLVKERRKRVARQLAMQRMQHAVPKADVVITNPTELAIALKYDSENMAAPRVVAKGAGYVAAKIRQIAIKHGVPIIERKPLAQAMYKTVEVGHEIPPAFYKAVAEILAYVYELAGKNPLARSRQALSSRGTGVIR